ncbi:hypothetical protein BU24DRAFT_403593 [Aaosphaeria arxii CBS 175.79]|uniref:Uncharacterized protein n=1 Tax=Aaosphaeria arxii CBS 175.79 TaxID=1450172 RepID=A0A6A5Y5C6_9PLEO|nr:uncharacterized protein BU24DRAFT_403593 [Aaosphaeria arxii CBS 175.79]KAF2020486.1 hypothetical protein BU24DRAFT_403593 [Aaosphaeria arxii CBS 175.79]
MDLLDVPPEVLEQIIRLYVDDVGVVKAWLRRDVCKTFKSFIQFEILAKQPLQAFQGVSFTPLTIYQRGESTYSRGMYDPYRTHFLAIRSENVHIRSEYLQYRIKQLNGCHPFVPSSIQAIVNDFVESSKDRQNYPMEKCIEILCRVTSNLPIWSLLWRSWDSSSHNLDGSRVCNVDRIAAAASIGDLHLLQKLILDHPLDVQQESVVLGYPLECAVIEGKEGSVVHLMHNLKKTKKTYRVRDLLHRAIIAAMRMKTNSTLELLLHIVQKDHKAFWRARVVGWWAIAAAAGRKDHIETILNTLPYGHSHENQRRMNESFRYICKRGFGDIAKRIIQQRHIDISPQHSPSQSYLMSAIENDQTDLIPLLVARGVSVERFSGRRGYNPVGQSPLRYAIRIRSIALVKILLKQGAKTNIDINHWLRKTASEHQTDESKQAEADIIELFKVARAAQSGRKGTKSTPTKQHNLKRKAEN